MTFTKICDAVAFLIDVLIASLVSVVMVVIEKIKEDHSISNVVFGIIILIVCIAVLPFACIWGTVKAYAK